MIPSLPTSCLDHSIYNPWEVSDDISCPSCGGEDALIREHPILPDFAVPSEFSTRLQQAISAICLSCGHLHRKDCYTRREIDRLFYLLGNKDQSTTGKYMAKNESVSLKARFAEYTSREYYNWKKRLTSIKPHLFPVRKILIIRPSSVGAMNAINEIFKGVQIYWKDYSEFAIDSIRKDSAYKEIQDGTIQSYFSLDSSNGPFDFIIVNHCLQHSISLQDDLKVIGTLGHENTIVHFANEVNRKLHNPFHMNHFSQATLTALLHEKYKCVLTVPNSIKMDQYKIGLFKDGVNCDFIASSAKMNL